MSPNIFLRPRVDVHGEAGPALHRVGAGQHAQPVAEDVVSGDAAAAAAASERVSRLASVGARAEEVQRAPEVEGDLREECMLGLASPFFPQKK